MGEKSLEIDGREVKLSHPDKVLFPGANIDKEALADYYCRIAPTALRHYRDRALTMHRFPDGIAAEGFFQKAMPDHFPDWIDRVTLPKADGEITHAVINDAATLAYLANHACITLHLALARIDRPDHPDRLVIDLDPSDDDFRKVQEAAKLAGDLLRELELPVFVQTTGSRGLHLVVPLDRSADFDTARSVARRLTKLLVARHPERLTIEHRKNKRGTKVFLDDLRNAYGQTAVAAYSVRAKEAAPVATPLHWHEVAANDLGPQKYTIKNIFRRLAKTEDPWKDISRHACAVRTIADRLDELDNGSEAGDG